MYLQIIIYVLGTALIAYISRRSLCLPGTHGFYRLFAWDAILALAILNLPRWFANPFALYQLISWILLLVSILPLIQGISLLRKHGGSRGKVDGSANFASENTAQLVTTGVYASIRHPLYTSLLFLTWGIYAKGPHLVAGILLATIASIFIYLTAYKEEEENLHTFGAEYEEYMKTTKRFIPHLF